MKITLEAASGLSSIVKFVNDVKTSGNLPSAVRQSIGSKPENHVLPMPEVIALLRINLSGGSVR
ncbi:MAG: hypothetical protein DME59_05835 [Verrucomicrobia bacterium]|nr:MAG: hypothetical protein DME59_05835 [Verrucomicrobiota bacterium]